MNRKIKNIVTSLVIYLALFAYASGQGIAYARSSDTLTIVFECELRYDGQSMMPDDIIDIELPGANEPENKMRYIHNGDSLNFVYFYGVDSSYDFLETQNHPIFSYYKSNQSCKSNNIEYSVDSAKSTDAMLVINKFEVFSHYFHYPDSIFCPNYGEIKPITDIPKDNFWISSPLDMAVLQNGVINSLETKPGYYQIGLFTDFCLEQYVDSIDIIILGGGDTLDLGDTLNYCANTMTNNLMDGFDVYSMQDVLVSNPGNQIINSGYYVFKSKETGCVFIDTLYINIIEPVDFGVIQEEHCDHILLSISSPTGSTENLSLTWSNQVSAESVRVDANNSVNQVVAQDKYGCKTTKEVAVEFKPFIVESVDYKITDSDCWKDGAFELRSLNVNYVRGEHYVTLKNAISGTVIKNTTDAIPAGVYEIHVSDVRDCKTVYPEKIKIVQNCLNDYPVFAPSLEEQYFIPHSGNIQIFDRFGILLKELDTPDYWDGTNSEGNPMPMGNYIMLTNEGKAINITIIR